jgi:hypothetical protein
MLKHALARSYIASEWPGYGRIEAGGGASEQVQTSRPVPEKADQGDLQARLMKTNKCFTEAEV